MNESCIKSGLLSAELATAVGRQRGAFFKITTETGHGWDHKKQNIKEQSMNAKYIIVYTNAPFNTKRCSRIQMTEIPYSVLAVGIRMTRKTNNK